MEMNIETLLDYSIQIRKYYARILNERLKDLKLSPNEMNILILLSNNPSMTTSTQLNVFLGVSKGLISRSVESLVKKDLIRIESDVTDRRIQHIFLTNKSEPVIKILKKEIHQINEDLLSDIPLEEMKVMEEIMIKMRNHFKLKNEEV